MGIDYNNLVRLIIKLMGLVFTIYAITSFATYVLNLLEVLKHGDIQLAWFGFLFPVCTYLAIGLFLWFFPKPIANTIIIGVSDQNAHNLENIAISLIGLVFLVLALSKLGQQLVLYNELGELSPQPQVMPHASAKAEIVGSIIQAVLGIVLLVQGKGIARIIRRVRDAGAS